MLVPRLSQRMWRLRQDSSLCPKLISAVLRMHFSFEISAAFPFPGQGSWLSLVKPDSRITLSEAVLELAVNLQVLRGYGWLPLVNEIQSSGAEPVRTRPKWNEADLLLPLESLADVSFLKMSWGRGRRWLLVCLISCRSPILGQKTYLKNSIFIEIGDWWTIFDLLFSWQNTKWLIWRKHLLLSITYFQVTQGKSCSLLLKNLLFIYFNQCPS